MFSLLYEKNQVYSKLKLQRSLEASTTKAELNKPNVLKIFKNIRFYTTIIIWSPIRDPCVVKNHANFVSLSLEQPLKYSIYLL